MQYFSPACLSAVLRNHLESKKVRARPPSTELEAFTHTGAAGASQPATRSELTEVLAAQKHLAYTALYVQELKRGWADTSPAMPAAHSMFSLVQGHDSGSGM